MSTEKFKTCTTVHFRHQVNTLAGCLLLSEYDTRNDIFEEPMPDVGVYLANQWEDELNIIKTVGKHDCFEGIQSGAPYPYVIVNWPDYGSISRGMAMKLVQSIIAALELGQYVEIGCMGGHGRTGTLAACVLARANKWTATKAITFLRDNYCFKAVETRSQVELVVRIAGSNESNKKINNLTPAKSWQPYGYGYGAGRQNGAGTDEQQFELDCYQPVDEKYIIDDEYQRYLLGRGY